MLSGGQVPYAHGHPGQVMVVEPLAEDLLPETAELLAEVFAESKGYGLYK